jgi:hypothetical protein
MINRFQKLLDVLPTHNHVWLENAKVRQGLETIIIDHYDDCLKYTGQTVIEQQGDTLTAARTWDKGSYPVDEEEINRWIRLIEEVYQQELLQLAPQNEQ